MCIRDSIIVIVLDNEYMEFKKILEFFGMWRFESSHERYQDLRQSNNKYLGKCNVIEYSSPINVFWNNVYFYVPEIHDCNK